MAGLDGDNELDDELRMSSALELVSFRSLKKRIVVGFILMEVYYTRYIQKTYKSAPKKKNTSKPCECVGDVTRLWQGDWWDCDFVLVEDNKGFSSLQIDPRAICFSRGQLKIKYNLFT